MDKEINNPPFLKDLMVEHAVKLNDAMAALKIMVEKSDDPAVAEQAEIFLEDQMVLRYILSNKKVSNGAGIADLVFETLKWRAANAKALAVWDTDPTDGNPPPFELGSNIGDIGMHYGQIGFMGHIDQRKLLEKHGGPEGFIHYCMHSAECARKMVLKRSRETGRLIKLVTITDLDGFQVSHCHMPFLRAIGQNSKNNEKHLPQLLLKAVITRPSSTFRMIWYMAKPLMSARTVEKISVCTGGHSGSIESCPFFKRIGTENIASVPQVLGGPMPFVES